MAEHVVLSTTFIMGTTKLFLLYLVLYVCLKCIKMMFGSSLPSVVCIRTHVLITLFICLHLVVSNIYCVVFLFYFSSSCVPYVAKFSGLSIIGCPFGILYVYLFSWDMSCTVIFPKYVKMCTINALLLYTYSMETYEVQNGLEVALQPVK